MEANTSGVAPSRSDVAARLRKMSPMTLFALAVMGMVVLSMLVSVWMNVQNRREMYAELRLESTRQTAGSLRRTAEVALAADDVSTLRRTVIETAAEGNLSICRVMLPNGQIVADKSARQISQDPLPEIWTGTAPRHSETLSGQAVTLTLPIQVTGRGPAVLEVSAPVKGSLGPQLYAQTAEICLAAGSLVGLLIIYRIAISRMRGTRAVYHALTDLACGHTDSTELEVAERFGAQATAWNGLLAERDSLTEQLTVQRVQESLDPTKNSKADLTAACDTLPQGLIVVDEELSVLYANGAAGVLLGVDRESFAGSVLPDVLSHTDVIEGSKTAARGPSHKRTIVEVQRGETLGSGVLRFIVRPVRRDDFGSAMIIIEDITQQRVAEESRKAFLAQAAHELRTPLTNIRLTVEEALEEAQDGNTPVVRQFSVINEESMRLERVVSDILSISEIEAGSLQLKRDDVRLDAMMEQLRAEYEAQARAADVRLTFDLPPKLPTIRGDRNKIALTLHNLLGNALKYTPANGRVNVTAAVNETTVAVDVSDTGIGIDEHDRTHIFERFYRAGDERLAKIKGSGLGLSLARDVAHLHGGDITVQSELNKGSTFTLTLPLIEEAA